MDTPLRNFDMGYLLPVFGISDDIQLRGLINPFGQRSMGFVQTWGGNMDIKMSHAAITYGIAHFEKKLRSPNTSITFNPASGNSLILGATFLTGHHIQSANQIGGNWDGSFSDFLGPRQLLDQMVFTYDIFGKLAESEQTAWKIHNAFKFGLTAKITPGVDLWLQKYRLENSFCTAYYFTLAISNIPLRDHGPGEVSKFEYQYGYFPKAQEYRVKVLCGVPDKKGERRSMFEQLSITNYNRFREPVFSSWLSKDASTIPVADAEIKDPLLAISTTFGLPGGNICISNEFDYSHKYIWHSIPVEGESYIKLQYDPVVAYSDTFCLTFFHSNTSALSCGASITQSFARSRYGVILHYQKAL